MSSKSEWYATIKKQIWVKDDGTEEEHDTVVSTIWTHSQLPDRVKVPSDVFGKIYKDGVFYNDPSEIPE